MAKITYTTSIEIQAERQKVWKTLLEPSSYAVWASEFSPGAHYEGEFKSGGTLVFKDQSGNGLMSKVVHFDPPNEVRMAHQGMVIDGTLSEADDKMSTWAGYEEAYRLEGSGGTTTVHIYQDLDEKEVKWVGDVWNRALKKIKELAEKD